MLEEGVEASGLTSAMANGPGDKPWDMDDETRKKFTAAGTWLQRSIGCSEDFLHNCEVAPLEFLQLVKSIQGRLSRDPAWRPSNPETYLHVCMMNLVHGGKRSRSDDHVVPEAQTIYHSESDLNDFNKHPTAEWRQHFNSNNLYTESTSTTVELLVDPEDSDAHPKALPDVDRKTIIVAFCAGRGSEVRVYLEMYPEDLIHAGAAVDVKEESAMVFRHHFPQMEFYNDVIEFQAAAWLEAKLLTCESEGTHLHVSWGYPCQEWLRCVGLSGEPLGYMGPRTSLFFALHERTWACMEALRKHEATTPAHGSTLIRQGRHSASLTTGNVPSTLKDLRMWSLALRTPLLLVKGGDLNWQIRDRVFGTLPRPRTLSLYGRRVPLQRLLPEGFTTTRSFAGNFRGAMQRWGGARSNHCYALGETLLRMDNDAMRTMDWNLHQIQQNWETLRSADKFDHPVLKAWRKHVESHYQDMQHHFRLLSVAQRDTLTGFFPGASWAPGMSAGQHFDLRGESIDGVVLRALWATMDRHELGPLRLRTPAEVMSIFTQYAATTQHHQLFLQGNFNSRILRGTFLSFAQNTVYCMRCGNRLDLDVPFPQCRKTCSCLCRNTIQIDVQWLPSSTHGLNASPLSSCVLSGQR